ncbi:hypothetical protein PENSPDRAFT_695474 [Peniophora sp. CONT]|nr:hypothetical protein PENSPDRAFT_695474 [Peniophora sp. CONT]
MPRGHHSNGASQPPAGSSNATATGKRKRGGRSGCKEKKVAHNNGQGSVPQAQRAHQAKKRRETRQREHVDAANAPPYERRHPKLFYKRTHCLRLLNLRTCEVKYTTAPGGYVGRKSFRKKVYTVEELKAMGFVELEWDGEDTIVIFDKDSRVICVLVGRPQGLTLAERNKWDARMADLVRAFEEERTRHQTDFKNHGCGAFAAFATGFTMGPGCLKPTNSG